jgi:hypothetical protein
MKIYKLNYQDQEMALADLKAKYIIDENRNIIFGTLSVAYVGKVIKDQPTSTTAATYKDGYHVDIMTDRDIIFNINNIAAESNHNFA